MRIFLAFILEPEVFGLGCRFSECDFDRKSFDLLDYALNLLLNRVILIVGTDCIFGVSLQIVQRKQLQTPLGQPQRIDLFLLLYRHRWSYRGTRIFMNQQPFPPTAGSLVNQFQKRLEVHASWTSPRQQYAVRRMKLSGPYSVKQAKHARAGGTWSAARANPMMTISSLLF